MTKKDPPEDHENIKMKKISLKNILKKTFSNKAKKVKKN